MKNKFFDTIKSAIFVVEEENVKAKAEVPNQQSNYVNVSTVQDGAETANNVEQKVVTNNTTTLNQGLLDKLCERLESMNFPGPDYMELKTAMNDEFIIEAVPDENKRMAIAFKTLKSSTPSLTKEHVIETLDKYIGFLKDWEKDAVSDINQIRNEVSDKKQAIEDINSQISDLVLKRNQLQTEVDETETKCNKNESDMISAVGFLVKKLEEDKVKISTNL